MKHKLPRPGPVWRIPCQQDLQLILARASPPQVKGWWVRLFSLCLHWRFLNWLRHVNPKPIISPPSLNSTSNSFGEYTVGDCVRLSLRHICTHTNAFGGCRSQVAQLKADLSLSFSVDPGTLFCPQAFSCFFVLHRTPGDEEGINSCSVPLLDGVCSSPCYAFLAEKLEQSDL